MSEKQRVTITRAEYNALSDIRGLEEQVHYMVILAKQDKDGRYVLEGTAETFAALQRDLSDEIYHELSPPTRLKQLRKIYDRLCPDSDL